MYAPTAFDIKSKLEVENPDVEVTVPDVPSVKTIAPPKDSWEARQKYLSSFESDIRPGFITAGGSHAGQPGALAQSLGATVKAALGESVTGAFFTGFQYESGQEKDPTFDVVPLLRPQDMQYAGVALAAPNLEALEEFQRSVDERNQRLGIIAERPYVSLATMMILDPVAGVLEALTYTGIGSLISLPILANTLGRVKAIDRAFDVAKQSRKASMIGKEAFIGGGTGAASVYLSEQIKAGASLLEAEENLGEQVFFGTLIGGVLGGAVGVVGARRANKVTQDFVAANHVGQTSGSPNSPSFTPPVPYKSEIKAMLETEASPKPKRTKEETKTESEALAAQIEDEAPLRALGFAQLRKGFEVIGENLVTNTNLPPFIKRAASLVTAPYRNMSATNRVLYSPFGTARLYAMGLARNATEFLGTREGLIVPRSAQNRIEDLTTKGYGVQVELYRHFMEASGVKPGMASAEKMLLGGKLTKEKEFFAAVSAQQMHVGKPTEFTRNVNPHVASAAQAMHKLYKEFGDILKEYGLIKPEQNLEETLNYLNRHWDSQALLNNKDDFTEFLANFFRGQNEKLKSILPFYHQERDVLRSIQADTRQFEKGAEKIEALQKTIDENFNNTVAEIDKQIESDTSVIEEKFQNQRDTVNKKYLSLAPDKVPDIKATKAALKSQIKEARKDRDLLTLEYARQDKKILSEIKEEKSRFRVFKDRILRGKLDKEIKEKLIKDDIEALQATQPDTQLTNDNIKELAIETADSIDDTELKALRLDMIESNRVEMRLKLEELRLARSTLQKERNQLLTINKNDLDKDVKVTADLLEQDAKLTGKNIEKSKKIEIRRALELKLVDLKEQHAKALKQKEYIKKRAALMEPVNRLEAYKKKYSFAGLAALNATRGQIRGIRRAESFNLMTPEKAKEAIKSLKRKERETIDAAEAVDEAWAVVDDLIGAAEKSAKKAENIIPWEFRSSTTGRPYKTWDEALEPEYAMAQAERSYWKMLGTEDKIITNPTLTAIGGAPSMFKPRALKMADDYPGIENWVERDARYLINNFTNGVAPPIALTELMQTLNELPLVRQSVKRMQVLDPNIGPKRALDMPDTMQSYTEIPKVMDNMLLEEFKDMAKGKSGEELIKLDANYKSARQEIKIIEQQIKGIFGNGVNVNSQAAFDYVSLINSLASTITLNNLVISMFGDIPAIALQYGIGNYVEKSLLPLLNSPELLALTKKEMKAMDMGLRLAQGAMYSARVSGRHNSPRNSKFGIGVSNLANRLGNITGATPFEYMTSITQMALIKNDLLNMVEKSVNGNISQKERTLLNQRSISPEKAEAIHNMFKRYGYDKDKSIKGIDPEVLDNMSPADAKAYQDYQNFITDQQRISMPRPGVGSKPNLSYEPIGAAVMYLKTWFTSATNDLFIPALQRADKEAFEGFMSLIAMGALQSKIRRIYRGEEEKEYQLEGFLADAVTNSGILGIYTFGLDAAVVSGIISGLGGARYDPMNGMPNLIFGPGVVGLTDRAFNIIGKMRKILTDEDAQFDFKTMNYIGNTIPLYKFAPISAVLKPALKDEFEKQGRGE